MAVSNDQVVRVTTNFSMAGSSNIQNVFHYTLAAGGPVEDAVFMGLVADHLSVAWGQIEGRLDTGLVVNAIDFYNLDTETELGSAPFNDTLFTPDGTGDGLPAGVAALLIFDTATPRRQGKKYIAGITEGQFDNGVWVSACLLDLGNMGATLMDNIDDDPIIIQPIIYSASAGVGSAIVSGVVRGLPAYQRRRKQGVGS